MSRREQLATLIALGFLDDEALSLLRIAKVLHRWHELECGNERGCIVRDDETGFPYWQNAMTGELSRIHDRDESARRRLDKIMKEVNARRKAAGLGALDAYIQTDPRGAPLYIIRPGDIPEGESVWGWYSRGLPIV